MEVVHTHFDGVKILKVRYFEDERGYFVETFSARSFAAAGLPSVFVQDNQSLSRTPGTLRGMHWQVAPFAQTKLVRVACGAGFAHLPPASRDRVECSKPLATIGASRLRPRLSDARTKQRGGIQGRCLLQRTL